MTDMMISAVSLIIAFISGLSFGIVLFIAIGYAWSKKGIKAIEDFNKNDKSI